VAPAGRDFGQWSQNEAALDHPRVGQNGIRRFPHETGVEDVDVDLPRPVAESPDASLRMLDRLERREQRLQASRPPDLRDGVAEVGLVAIADRVGSVEG
jgi:hypothetical protein